VKALINKKANLSVVDENGDTPAEYARKIHSHAILEILETPIEDKIHLPIKHVTPRCGTLSALLEAQMKLKS